NCASLYLLHCSAQRPHLHSFPTRRSSDLGEVLKRECNQNDVAPITADRTRRLGDCSRDPRASDPFWESCTRCPRRPGPHGSDPRSEEHTSELQSRSDLVCRLLLEQKKQPR